MLSSKDGLFDRARGRIVGSEHYLTKPFTKDELLGAIEAHIHVPAGAIPKDGPSAGITMAVSLFSAVTTYLPGLTAENS